MKKLFLVAVIAVFSSTVANAQEVKFGAKAGVNVATLTGKSADDAKSLSSFHVGAVAELGLSDKFAIQPELVYSIQGASQDISGSNFKNELSYLNVPIMAKYFVAEGFSVELGPQIGFLMSAKVKANGNSLDVKENFKGIDFGLGLGAGYRLDNGLNFGARYNIGLSNIADTSKSTIPNDTELKNGVFQISVGYFFN